MSKTVKLRLITQDSIRLAAKKLERFILNAGDILISLTGNIGRVGIIQQHQLPAVLNQRVARITVKDELIERDYLFLFYHRVRFVNVCRMPVTARHSRMSVRRKSRL
jgi:restriction endonuclease S subunit